MSKWMSVDEVEKWLRAGCAYAIRELPSIDLVRCGECKYKEKCEQIVVFDTGKNQLEGRKIDSCSYGKRREDDEVR